MTPSVSVNIKSVVAISTTILVPATVTSPPIPTVKALLLALSASLESSLEAERSSLDPLAFTKAVSIASRELEKASKSLKAAQTSIFTTTRSVAVVDGSTALEPSRPRETKVAQIAIGDTVQNEGDGLTKPARLLKAQTWSLGIAKKFNHTYTGPVAAISPLKKRATGSLQMGDGPSDL